jgi:hypothetical protein
MIMRKGEFITTYTGINFYIIDPRIEDISGTDIAHALSLICRANGHFKHFYSIAQHSINCYNEAVVRGYSKRVQLACLLHDGSEAYISDVTRPVKAHLPQYLEIESKIQSVVYERFGIVDLTNEEINQVSDVDDTVLWFEFETLHNMPMWREQPVKYADFDLSFRNMQEVEKEFLEKLRGII